jgi:hypothetical protein
MGQQPDDKQKVDLSQFTMNPVEVRDERVKFAGFRLGARVVAILVAVGLIVGGIWLRSWIGRGGSLHGLALDEARDPAIRMNAEEFKQGLMQDFPGLAGEIEAVAFVRPSEDFDSPARLDMRLAAVERTEAQLKEILGRAMHALVSFMREQESLQFDQASVRAYMSGRFLGEATYNVAARKTIIELAPGAASAPGRP